MSVLKPCFILWAVYSASRNKNTSSCGWMNTRQLCEHNTGLFFPSTSSPNVSREQLHFSYPRKRMCVAIILKLTK